MPKYSIYCKTNVNFAKSQLFGRGNGARGPIVPGGKAVKVNKTNDTLEEVGRPMSPEQARKAVDNNQDVFASDRQIAKEIAGKGAVGPEIHRDPNRGNRFWHFHRRNKSNSRTGSHGRKGAHIFFGPGE